MKNFDLQVNGAFGVDFSNPELTEDDVLRCTEQILARGCTRFLPTLPTAPMETYRRNLPLLNHAIDSHGLRYAVPGLHLEGPFISDKPGAVGAHRPECVLPPSKEKLQELNDIAEGHIAILTVAAEIPGMRQMIKDAHEMGICVSLGHELAGEEDIDNAGADAMTHLGNGLPNQLDRHHNPIWTGLSNDNITVMAIADGHHLPARLLKCYIRCKGIEKLIVVSDACNVAGLPPGRYYSYGNDAVLEPNGLYHNPEKHCLVGSASLLPDCIKFLQRENLLSDADIEKAVWTNPHKLLHMAL